jgi:hypothetical protein
MRVRTKKGTFAPEDPQEYLFFSDTVVLLLDYLGEKVACKLDPADYALVKNYRWNILRHSGAFHVLTKVDGKPLYMHTMLTGFPKTDHRDLNGTNNRRDNLRPCTQQQNGRNCGPKKNNKSGYKGVYFYPSRDKYAAEISTGARRIKLGYFASKEDAARAYDKAAKEHFGEFAWLNFPNAAVAHV